MSKPSLDFKTPLIVLVALIALFVCIFFAMKLLSVNSNETENNAGTEAPRASNGTLILRAVDGDTLEMAGGEMIRLLCVDAPELGDVGYEEAKDYLSSLLVLSGAGAGAGAEEGEENIRIERQGIDKYNRTLAWIYSGETLVNKEIIDNGYGDVFLYEGMDCGRVE